VTTVVIDACCLINLAAADAFATWLPRLGLEWKVPQAVVGEALFLRVLNDPSEPDREPIDLEPFIASGLLDVVAPEGEEEIPAFVAYARHLDDGEAMALSLAASRGWVLATDDRRARSMAESARVQLMSTPEILKRWVDRDAPTEQTLSETLLRIKQRARYLPGVRDPLFDWWMAHLPASQDN
jgi:hypothetical protein